MNAIRLCVYEGALTTDNFEKHAGVKTEDALKEVIEHVREMEQTEKMLRDRIRQLKYQVRGVK